MNATQRKLMMQRWNVIQHELLPELRHEVGDLTPKLEKMIHDLEWGRIKESLGHVLLIDHNARRGEKIEFDPAQAMRYNERKMAERSTRGSRASRGQPPARQGRHQGVRAFDVRYAGAIGRSVDEITTMTPCNSCATPVISKLQDSLRQRAEKMWPPSQHPRHRDPICLKNAIRGQMAQLKI